MERHACIFACLALQNQGLYSQSYKLNELVLQPRCCGHILSLPLYELVHSVHRPQ
jgi:hypothetical protein